MAYGKINSEGELETVPKDKAPPPQWPERGMIELHNVNFQYAVNYPYVLKSVSLKIESCKKVILAYCMIKHYGIYVYVDWHCG